MGTGKKICRIIADITKRDVKEIDVKLSFEVLEVDSMLFIQVLVACEVEFEIEFGDDMLYIERFSSIEAFIEYVDEIINKISG